MIPHELLVKLISPTGEERLILHLRSGLRTPGGAQRHRDFTPGLAAQHRGKIIAPVTIMHRRVNCKSHLLATGRRVQHVITRAFFFNADL